MAFDDNTQPTQEERESAFIWSGSVQTRAESNYRRHALNFIGSATVSQPLTGSNSNSNSIDWLLGADGRLDLTRRSHATGGLSYSRVTEDPEDAESEGARNAQIFSGNAGFEHNFTRFTSAIDFFASRREEDDSQDSSFRQSQRFREDNGREEATGDQTSYGVSAPFTYPVSERLSLRFTPSWRRTLRDEDEENSTDTQVFSTALGGSYLVVRGLTLSTDVGFQFRRDDDGETDFSPLESLAFNFSVSRPIGGRTILDFSAYRIVSDTTVEGASARRNTGVRTGVTYQISNPLTLRAHIEGTHSDFQGANRTDDLIAAQTILSYQITTNLSVSASYRYSQRFSDEGKDYYRNVAFVSLSAQF